MKYLLSIFLITTFIMSNAQSDYNKDKTIQVNSQAKTKVQPDQAVIHINVRSHRNEFDETLENLNDIIDDAKKILKKERIDDDKIKTTNYNIRKNYIYNNGKQKEDGFVATSNIEVTINMDTKKLSDLIERFAKEAPDLSLNIGFSVSDELMEKIKSELLVEAVKRARNQANTIAGALGKNITDIKTVSYSESGGGHYPIMQKSMAYDAAESSLRSAPPIENVDDIEISLHMNTTWLLNP